MPFYDVIDLFHGGEEQAGEELLRAVVVSVAGREEEDVGGDGLLRR